MKVSELIEALNKCPPDMEVQTSSNGMVEWVILHTEVDLYSDNTDKDNNYVEIG